jgi:hypothetical protein
MAAGEFETVSVLKRAVRFYSRCISMNGALRALLLHLWTLSVFIDIL